MTRLGFLLVGVILLAACRTPDALVLRARLKAQPEWPVVRQAAQAALTRSERMDAGWKAALAVTDTQAIYPLKQAGGIWLVHACADYPLNRSGVVVEMEISDAGEVRRYTRLWKEKPAAHAASEADLERLLEKGDYHQAIAALEHGPVSAEERFALGLLYAYWEIAERGEAADFTSALQAIRAAAPEKEEARRLLADYERRGAQAFFAFPWAHLIGPFPERRRPQPEARQVQLPEPTSGLAPNRRSS